MRQPPPPPPPSRADIEHQLLGLLSGDISRDAAHDWAVRWIVASDPGVDDEVVWRLLQAIVAADAKSTDREYLYEAIDFQAWLAELRSADLD